MNYGLPWKGSKSRLLPGLLDCLPSSHTLVDLFAGGCAVTHAALLSGRFGKVIANEIQPGVARLFKDAAEGKCRGLEKEWVSREDFFKRKESEPWIKACWSFGNNGRDYLYGKPVEPYKRAVHCAVLLDDWDEFERLCPETADAAEIALKGLEDAKERRIALGRAVVRRLKELGNPSLPAENPLYGSCHFKGGKPKIQSLERLQSLESLESLERLERLQRLESLEISGRDYREVRIPDGATVYADPPYAGTNGYGAGFDNAAFWEWARSRPFPVFVSEYKSPDDFLPVWGKAHRSILCSTKNNSVTERVFVHKRFFDKAMLLSEVA